MQKKLHGFRALPFGSGIREMHTDITECECTQNRIGDGVQKDIRVGVPA